jgi:ABC-2 type transport system permease protein
MNSLKACIRKEIYEGIKTHKFLIIAIGILFFALVDPVMLKLTPMILESQFGTADPNLMKGLDLSQKGVLIKYAGDLFQLGTLITAFTLAGMVSSERSNKTLTIPASMGCKVWAVVISKVMVYGLYCIIMTTLGMLAAYYYGGIIFGGSIEVDVVFAVKAGMLYGIFYIAMLSILVFFSSILKKGFAAGILTLLSVYLLSAVGPLFRIEKYLPSNLMKIATSIGSTVNTDIIISLFCTVVLIVFMNAFSVMWLKRVELV